MSIGPGKATVQKRKSKPIVNKFEIYMNYHASFRIHYISFILITFGFNCFSQTNNQQKFNSLFEVGTQPELVAENFRFAEGPAADAFGNIYFSDIGNDRIHYWDIRSKKLLTIRENSGGTSGLFVDRKGAVWFCELRAKQLTRLNINGSYEVVLDSFEGKPLTGVNDMWIDRHDGIYFSDSYPGSEVRTDDHRVFYYSSEGKLKLLADTYSKSNGIHGTKDGKWLYVADYIKYKVYRYEILEPGVLGERTVFAEYRCDGMTVDEKGNVYLCTGNSGQGVVVIDQEGNELGKINLSENAANVCFGGPDNKTLFISASQGLYSVKMNVQGIFHDSPVNQIFEDNGGLMSLIKEGATPEILASGFRIAQGPAAAANGDVYFTDIYHQKIMKWSFLKNELSTVREQTGGPDGLYFEKDGSLLVCELTGKRLARLKPDGEYEIIADTFQGEPLTGANDVYVDEDGGIYFSDSYPGSNIRGADILRLLHCPG